MICYASGEISSVSGRRFEVARSYASVFGLVCVLPEPWSRQDLESPRLGSTKSWSPQDVETPWDSHLSHLFTHVYCQNWSHIDHTKQHEPGVVTCPNHGKWASALDGWNLTSAMSDTIWWLLMGLEAVGIAAGKKGRDMSGLYCTPAHCWSNPFSIAQCSMVLIFLNIHYLCL